MFAFSVYYFLNYNMMNKLTNRVAKREKTFRKLKAMERSNRA